MRITGKRLCWVLPALIGAATVLSVYGWVNQLGAAGPAAQGQAAPQGGTQQKQKQGEEALVVAAADIPDTILITGELQAARSREIQVPQNPVRLRERSDLPAA